MVSSKEELTGAKDDGFNPATRALWFAAQHQGAKELVAAIKDGADVNGCNQKGSSLLYWLLDSNRSADLVDELIEVLLKNGAHSNIVNPCPDQLGLLAKAISCPTTSSVKRIQLLLEHGANPNSVMGERSPLWVLSFKMVWVTAMNHDVEIEGTRRERLLEEARLIFRAGGRLDEQRRSNLDLNLRESLAELDGEHCLDELLALQEHIILEQQVPSPKDSVRKPAGL